MIKNHKLRSYSNHLELIKWIMISHSISILSPFLFIFFLLSFDKCWKTKVQQWKTYKVNAEDPVDCSPVHVIFNMGVQESFSFKKTTSNNSYQIVKLHTMFSKHYTADYGITAPLLNIKLNGFTSLILTFFRKEFHAESTVFLELSLLW